MPEFIKLFDFCAQLSFYRKSRVRQTKDMLNSIIYKLLVIKHGHICVVYWSGVGVPGRKLLG